MSAAAVKVISAAGLFLGLTACAGPRAFIPPSPVQDLSATAEDGVVTFDLRDRAGVTVEVEGRSLNLLLLARQEPVLILNREIVEALSLPPVLFGLGSAEIRDGNHIVTGEVRRARYRVPPGVEEQAWALDLEADIHPDYDGAISFGTIPASRFRLLIDDREPGATSALSEVTFSAVDPSRGGERNFADLEFTFDLALYQDPVTVNRKATLYLSRAGRLTRVSEVTPASRLFGNVWPHARFEVDPPMMLGERPVTRLLGEVAPDFQVEAGDHEPTHEVIEVFEDLRTPGHDPKIYLGRSFFAGCTELVVEREIGRAHV